MDPLTLIGLGSMAIKAIGKMRGGKTQEVTEKVAGMVDLVSGLPKDKAADHLQAELDKMPPGDLLEFEKCKVELERIAADLEKSKIQAESDRYSESQETIREQINSTDEFVRRTRPTMARRSFWAGTVYIILAEGLEAFNHGTGASVELAGMLYSASVFYTTMRTAESFSKSGKTASGKGFMDLVQAGRKMIGK